jgi:hypothetical protein
LCLHTHPAGAGALKDAEDLIYIAHVEANAIVTHKIDWPIRGGLAADLDARSLAISCELKRVIQYLESQYTDQI